MMRTAGLSLVLALLAGPVLGQGGGPPGGFQPPPDHWITTDSLMKALGITDAKIKDAVAPHLAEVDKIMKTVAEDRAKMRAAMQAGGGMPSDSARQAMMGKNQEWQKGLDAHLGAVREALPEANRAAFDALQKPAIRMGGVRRMGGGGQ